MRIARGSDAPLEEMATDTFSGTVRRRDLGSVENLDGTALAVTFEAGARTAWHSHPAGQVIYVIEGVGRVATREAAAVELRAGDLVEVPPGEEHWHGASDRRAVTHLALSFGETAWLEPVTDD